MTPWRRNDRSRFLYQRCVCVRCRTFRINGLSGANLDLSFVLLKRNNNVATLNNIAANYLDDHSALLLISGSMPILSFHETLDNKNPYGTDVEYTVLLLQGVHNSLVLDHLPTSFFFSIVHKYNPCIQFLQVLYCVIQRNLPQKSWFLGCGSGRHPVSFPRTKWRGIITTPGPSGLQTRPSTRLSETNKHCSKHCTFYYILQKKEKKRYPKLAIQISK